jgi:hypothetical protein
MSSDNTGLSIMGNQRMWSKRWRGHDDGAHSRSRGLICIQTLELPLLDFGISYSRSITDKTPCSAKVTGIKTNSYEIKQVQSIA